MRDGDRHCLPIRTPAFILRTGERRLSDDCPGHNGSHPWRLALTRVARCCANSAGSMLTDRPRAAVAEAMAYSSCQAISSGLWVRWVAVPLPPVYAMSAL